MSLRELAAEIADRFQGRGLIPPNWNAEAAELAAEVLRAWLAGKPEEIVARFDIELLGYEWKSRGKPGLIQLAREVLGVAEEVAMAEPAPISGNAGGQKPGEQIGEATAPTAPPPSSDEMSFAEAMRPDDPYFASDFPWIKRKEVMPSARAFQVLCL